MPHPLHPEPGGLVPWGITANGDVCWWIRADRDPARWTVAVSESRGPDWSRFPGTMCAFLAAVIAGVWRCPIFPEDVPSRAPAFTAHS